MESHTGFVLRLALLSCLFGGMSASLFGGLSSGLGGVSSGLSGVSSGLSGVSGGLIGSSSSKAVFKEKIKATYSMDQGIFSQGFYDIPLNTRSPLIKNYVKVAPESTFRLPLDFYCYPNDPRVCFMYDTKGNIAGSQIAYLAEDVSNVNPTPYNYSSVGGFTYTVMMNRPAFVFRAYFTNPEKLTTAGRQNTDETIEGVWVYLEGRLVEIPREEPKSSPHQGFYKQACFPQMGQHYFYKMNRNVPCDQLLPFFTLYNQNKLVGIGIAGFGKGSSGKDRSWYEKPPLLGAQQIIPNRPACFESWYNKYGLYTFHLYFTNSPQTIICPLFG